MTLIRNSQPLEGQSFSNPGDGGEDIPIALRDSVDLPSAVTQRSLPPWWLLAGFMGLSLGILGVALWFFNLSVNSNPPNLAQGSESSTEVPTTNPPGETSPGDDSLLGHHPYAEAPLETLVPIDDRGELLLRRAAAEAFTRMKADAAASGVALTPLSAYRSIADQQYLFFDVKSQRGQDTSTRAEVSAPPGYSEHHTGYALDIGDLNAPTTNLNISFEETEAFEWLKNNASYYSFELSFPRDNPQGINYEPWHWRYVGDQDSLETFFHNRS